MRLSRTRVLLRLALLVVGGAFMLARAWEVNHAARLAQGSEALLASRVALVWALVGALALLTAGSAAFSLRRRGRRRTLRLGDVMPPDAGTAGRRPPPAQ